MMSKQAFRSPISTTSILASCLAVALCGPAQANTRDMWRDSPASPAASAKNAAAAATALPSHYRTLTLDFAALRTTLAAPAVASGRKATSDVQLSLPLPEGGFTQFKLTDSGTLPAALAQRFPQIRSLKGVDDAGRQLRLDVDDNGMHAMVFDQAGGTWLVQPSETLAAQTRKAPAQDGVYLSYRRADLPAPEPFNETDNGLRAALQTMSSRSLAPLNQAHTATGGGILRDYRLAVAATSSYSAVFGGTVQGALAGVVRMVNRINEIFERDMGVHFTLAADNDKIIFTDPANDPYLSSSNSGNTDALLELNVKVVNKIIGEDRFDVGHLVDTGSGGVAGRIGNTCLDGSNADNDKAAGYTGRNNPVGDAFYIDFVAPELGHQFGAWHSFNGCDRSTQEAFAFEPGSGSTIMGYASMCGSHDLQAQSDTYFHAGSLDQIQQWMASEGGRCAVKRFNPYQAPWIDPESMKRRTIPALTPFMLNVVASFGNYYAKRTYIWEQMDTGPEQALGVALKDDGQGPILRSWPPTTSASRSFPSMAAVLGDEPLGAGQVYPATNRNLNFRLTVRDDYDTQSTSTSADLRLRVVDTGQAFAVTAPNDIEIWTAGTTKYVRWQVAGTNKAPISCTAVDIQLSTDGGYTYLRTPLATRIPNFFGQARVTIPALDRDSTRGRVKVSCSDNIFFAVSPTNLVLKKK
ncbi:reprolysin-like metallopeptidase [Dyella silvatica]|uniref:reprolysin-like metallopeptidase n=1 Tax=Dyella silvatica TaxID=2992128 RepID=UPI0022518646|nr:M12 family metallo-peptidase [Dyella silvatica]